jgi:hypothetical protein
MKTSELTGAALDWAVCKLVSNTFTGFKTVTVLIEDRVHMIRADTKAYSPPLSPSTKWVQGGPIIECEKLHVYPAGDQWGADCEHTQQFGPTPLIAAMRCYVASKMGDEVDVPKELT